MSFCPAQRRDARALEGYALLLKTRVNASYIVAARGVLEHSTSCFMRLKNHRSAASQNENESAQTEKSKAFAGRSAGCYCNAMLHVVAWNGLTEMFDLLIKLGANPALNNRDRLTPFTLTARYGIWNVFNHIFE